MSKITEISIDDSALAAPTPEIEQERRVAIFDLLEGNSFSVPQNTDVEELNLLLAIRDRRLVFEVKNINQEPVAEFHLSLGPFRQVVKDYFPNL